jgi:hypothetical protein
MRNKPPLLAVAIALFGNGSYIATHSQNPAAYERNVTPFANDDDTTSFYSRDDTYYKLECREWIPLSGLLDKHLLGQGRCVKRDETNSMPSEIKSWLQGFWAGSMNDIPRAEERMHKAFNAAVFLANYIQLSNAKAEGYDGSLTVNYDLGTDTTICALSASGEIAISVLLGFYLLGIGAVALYLSCVPCWSPTMDAFAMMKIGASIPGEVSLLAGGEENVDALDKAPGLVGDVHPDAPIGRLGLGAQGYLKVGREYYSY